MVSFATIEAFSFFVAAVFLGFRDLACGGFKVCVVYLGGRPFFRSRYCSGAAGVARIVILGGSFLVDSPKAIEFARLFY